MGLTEYEKNRVVGVDGKTKSQRWREKNRERQAEYSSDWAARHPEKVKQYAEASAARHRVLLNARREELKATPIMCERCSNDTIWPRRLCDECREKARAENNRARYGTDRYRDKCAKAMRKRRSNYNTKITPEFLGWVYGCAWCGDEDSKLELDHIIPLSKDGPHVVWNTVFACRKCNARRGSNGSNYKKVLPPTYDRG